MTEQESAAATTIPSYHFNAERQVEILKAFAIFFAKNNKGATYKEIASILSADKNNVSGALKFWKEHGFLIPEKGSYTPSESLREFNQRIQWGDNDEAWRIFRKAIESSWFVSQVRMKFQLTSIVTKEELVKLLGIGSGAASGDKNAQKSISIIIDLLEMSKLLVKDQDNNYSISSESVEKTRGLELPDSKEMIQVKIGEQVYAIETKKICEFVLSNGKKIDRKVQEIG